jgi:hypothetical protein
MQPPQVIVMTACVGLVLAGGSCSGDDATAQKSADAGMQFGTLVAARDVGLASAIPVRGLKDIPGPAVSTGYRGTRLTDVFIADGVYCLAVGPAPGADEGSQAAWVTAGVGTSTEHQRTWDPDVTTCDEALQGIRRSQADESSKAKIRRMLRSLDRSRVTRAGRPVLDDLQ